MIHLDDFNEALAALDKAVFRHEWTIQRQLFEMIEEHLVRLEKHIKADLIERGACPHERPINLTALGDPCRTYICGDCGERWKEDHPL